ncbi:CLUMA_CG004924, isoform B [Clunio marinus]|uniref:ubiquitinyl hydrolase 1 n=1 Tax=Clunio marinus TaxID=568069 RepID=A0A1J1HTC5_9DIPT|nr:CLUMA_CG004924, isoform B [Clunio marinus]
MVEKNIRSVALRNTLPSTTSTKTWDRDYSSSYYRTPLSDSKRDKNETRNNLSGSSYAAGGYRASNISPTKSPSRDSIYDRKTSALVEGQCGLWNIGNTCFMNSVLQCLNHTNDLSKYARSPSALTTSTNKGSTSLTKDLQIWNEFCSLIQQMWQPGAKSINPSELKMALSSKYRMYSGSAQQDAQEFLRYILDALHGALNLGGKKVSLHVDDTMRKQMSCGIGIQTERTQSLRIFLLANLKVLFTFCKANRKCIKGFTIQRFPKYLVIHLKRFSEMRWTKLTNIVEFPIAKLDLTPYASESMEKSDPPPVYTLYGISNHMGSTHGGHYVASCKHPVNKKWFEYNDNFVSEITESSLVTSSAYLLFYERL